MPQKYRIEFGISQDLKKTFQYSIFQYQSQYHNNHYKAPTGIQKLLYMSKLTLQSIVNAHNRSEITTLIKNPHSSHQLISIGHDSSLKVWNKTDFSAVRQIKIRSPYLNTLTPFGEKFLIGIGNGSIIVLSKQLEAERTYQIHSGCVSSIIVQQHHIISSGYDGFIHFLNQVSFEIERSIKIQTVIYRVLKFENYLYIASKPSYRLNLQTMQMEKMENFKQFVTHKNLLFGCSDESGITCLSDNTTMNIPCEFLISTISKIIVFNIQHKEIGWLSYDTQTENRWQMIRINEIQQGFCIQSGIVEGNKVYACGQSGKIYIFQCDEII